MYCKESQEYESWKLIFVILWALVSLYINVDENTYLPGLLWDFIEINRLRKCFVNSKVLCELKKVIVLITIM